MNIGHCRYCGRPVIWLKHRRTQRPAPINLPPDPEGNVVLLENDRFITITDEERDSPRAREHLYRLHSETCPAMARAREERAAEIARSSYEASLRLLGEREPDDAA